MLPPFRHVTGVQSEEYSQTGAVEDGHSVASSAADNSGHHDTNSTGTFDYTDGAANTYVSTHIEQGGRIGRMRGGNFIIIGL